MTEPALGLSGEDQELAVRTARKEGRQVVSLRSIARASGEFVVECEVYPVSGLKVEPLTPGPYTFATSQEASLFVDEALEALTYLGCDVA
jgi:hypothetical protein